jgi:hypothetical protein
MNLPLLNARSTAVLDRKLKELALTLMKLLINTAPENNILPPANGERDEPLEAQR